jgi:hypothetical protein
MITLYDFIAMDDNGRADAAWSGTYLGERQEGELIVQLYSLPDFYAEVFYDSARNQVARIRGFKKLQLLAPYFASGAL